MTTTPIRCTCGAQVLVTEHGAVRHVPDGRDTCTTPRVAKLDVTVPVGDVPYLQARWQGGTAGEAAIAAQLRAADVGGPVTAQLLAAAGEIRAAAYDRRSRQRAEVADAAAAAAVDHLRAAGDPVDADLPHELARVLEATLAALERSGHGYTRNPGDPERAPTRLEAEGGDRR